MGNFICREILDYITTTQLQKKITMIVNGAYV